MVDLQWVFAERPKIATERWEWPAAIYRGPYMRQAAHIVCDVQYHEILARAGCHAPLSVVILRYNLPNQNPSESRRMLYRDTQFRRLEHAIAWTNLFINQNPTWHPTLI